jgi:Sulfatase
MMKPMLKRAMIALSLANLCFIPVWREVLDPGPSFYCYHTKVCTLSAELAGVTLDAIMLAALFFTGFEIIRRVAHPHALKVAYCAFLLALLLPINGFRVQFPALTSPVLSRSLGRAGFVLTTILIGLGLVALAVLAARRFGLARVAKGGATVVLIFSPFIGVAYAQTLWRIVKYREALTEPSAAAASSVRERPGPSARVLWLIFDELDYRVAFLERPATLKLPELDRLRDQSLFANEAYPPAGLTVQALPALISGRLVAEAKQTRPNELAVRFHEETQWVGWRTSPNIFARTHELGFSSALVGWHHPYCRLFGGQLVQCSWKPDALTEEAVARRSGIKDNMLRDARIILLSLPVVPRFMSQQGDSGDILADSMGHAAQDFQEMLEDARRISTDPGIQLAFVHLPIPHPPGFYDRTQGRASPDRKNSYLDSLALVDRTLGELRRALEEAGRWDSTAVLVSSDHWWRAREMWSPVTGAPAARAFWNAEDEKILPRSPDYRVPFMLKLPGQTRGAVYAQPFNTVLSHDLILSILRGEMSSSEDAAAWLDRHRSIGVSPYYDSLIDAMKDKK